MAYDNSNRGAIWKNDNKTEDKHPDFKGSLNVGGVEYWVSAWKRKESAAEKAPALSFQIQLKDGARPAGERDTAPPKKPAGRNDDMDGDTIPF